MVDSLRVYMRQGHSFTRPLTPYLAALGHSEDAHAIASRSGDGLTAEEIVALGRIGLAQTVPTLLAALVASDDPVHNRALTSALEQICGVRRPEAETAEETEVQVSDAQWWDQWWHAYGPRFDPGALYRRGRPSEPKAIVDELLDPARTIAERHASLLDLRVRAKMRIGLSLRWPVREQVEVLERTRAQLVEMSR